MLAWNIVAQEVMLMIKAGRVVASCFVLSLALLFFISYCSPEVNGVSAQRWQFHSQNVSGVTVNVVNGFRGPYGVTAREGVVYVSDIRDSKIYCFDEELSMSLISDGICSSRLLDAKGPHSVDFTADQLPIVTFFYDNVVGVMNSEATFDYNVFNQTALNGPANTYVDQHGNIWISDWYNHRIIKYDKNFKLLGWLGETDDSSATGFKLEGSSRKSTLLGGFNKPHMVAVDNQGYIYVVETGNNRVQKFAHDGTPIGWLGVNVDGSYTGGFIKEGRSSQSRKNGGFSEPVSLTIHNDIFLVADNGNNRVQRFSLNGQYKGWIGGDASNAYFNWSYSPGPSLKGEKIGYFAAPFNAVVVDNKIIVADGHNNRIVSYSYE